MTSPRGNTAHMRPFSLLTYHELVESQQDLAAFPATVSLYKLTVGEFRSQMERLAAMKLRGVSLADAMSWVRQDGEDSGRPVTAVTFDDGNESDVTQAAPILEEAGCGATFFITAGWIGQPGRPAREQIASLHEQGYEIGSHLMTHRFPSTLTEDELRSELRESKGILEDITGEAVRYVSSPSGYDSGLLPKLAEEEGYEGAVMGAVGLNDERTDAFRLRRLVIKRTYPVEQVAKMAMGDRWLLARMRAAQAARNAVRRVAGPGVYEGVRKMLIRAR